MLHEVITKTQVFSPGSMESCWGLLTEKGPDLTSVDQGHASSCVGTRLRGRGVETGHPLGGNSGNPRRQDGGLAQKASDRGRKKRWRAGFIPKPSQQDLLVDWMRVCRRPRMGRHVLRAEPPEWGEGGGTAVAGEDEPEHESTRPPDTVPGTDCARVLRSSDMSFSVLNLPIQSCTLLVSSPHLSGLREPLARSFPSRECTTESWFRGGFRRPSLARSPSDPPSGHTTGASAWATPLHAHLPLLPASPPRLRGATRTNTRSGGRCRPGPRLCSGSVLEGTETTLPSLPTS